MTFLTSLGRSLDRTVDLLRETIGRHAVRHRALAPLILLVWTRLVRLSRRFERLVLLWERGRLPARRARRPAGPRAPRPKPALRLPTSQGWLVKLVPHAGAFSGFVEAMLADPDTSALVAAHPAAGRVLRPWARMFGFPQPDYLKLPPRPRKPREPKPKKLTRKQYRALIPPVHDPNPWRVPAKWRLNPKGLPRFKYSDEV